MSRFTRLVVVTLAALLIVGCGKDSPLTGTGQGALRLQLSNIFFDSYDLRWTAER